MKNRKIFNHQIIRAVALTTLVSTTFASCAREQVPAPTRTEIESLGQTDTTPLEKLGHRISISGSACTTLTALAGQAGSVERFSILGAADLQLNPATGRLSGTGHIELAESPFTRLVLAEKFKVPTDDEFMTSVEAEHRAGRVSDEQLAGLQMIRRDAPEQFQGAKLQMISGQLAAKFPGVFGAAGELAASMPIGLLTKIAAERGDPSEIAKIATTALPLFSGTSWRDFSDEAEISLQGAVTGLKSVEASERVCGLVLLQRSFAQLLSLKGHGSPLVEMTRQDAGPRSKTPALSTENPELKKVDVLGAWIPMAQNTPVLLSSEAIAGYNPAVQFMTLSSSPSERGGAKGSFSDQVAMLEALTIFFEATSPAASWHDAGYPYGDVAESPTALLPPDAHSLALGMMVMAFKNVAALGIQKVNAQGSLLQPGEATAGVVIGQINPSTKKALVSAENVVRFVNSVVFLETSLQAFAKRPASEWKKVHASYEPAFLARLAGRSVFTASELSALMTEEEQAGILMNSLEQLHLPLGMLLAKLKSGQVCVSEAEWDATTGAIQVLGLCDARMRAQVKLAKERLARLTNASILLDR